MKRTGPTTAIFNLERLLRFRLRLSLLAWRIAKEPPLRLLTMLFMAIAPVSMRTKSLWDAVRRPSYLVGLIKAAEQAKRDKEGAFSAIEFGVAAGTGLLLLEKHAAAVERETGVSIEVYGFDIGKGMPKPCGDHRDHPDLFVPGQFAMDEHALRQRLSPRTTLLIGDVAQTVPAFVRDARHAPIGFIASDFAYYSPTREALQVLSLPGKRMLKRVAMYFGYVARTGSHEFAGERLAIAEFNSNNHVKIDKSHLLPLGRPFHEAGWLQGMYNAHDIEAISKIKR